MLTADDVQKWLEERRARPGEPLGATPEADQDRAWAQAASGGAGPRGQGGAGAGGRGATVLVLRDPVRPPGPEGVLAAMGSVPEPERHRWPWAATLAVGVLSGLVLGVGVVGLAGSAPRWLASALDAGEVPAESGDSATAAPAPQAEPSPTEAALPEPAPREPAPREPTTAGPVLLDPVPAAPAPPASVAPTRAAPAPELAGPAASDAAPPEPKLVDAPGRDPRAVLVQADRRPLRRLPALLGTPEPDEGPAVFAASAPAGAEPWQPSPRPAPEPGTPVRVAADASPAVVRIAPVRTLAAPPPPDPLPPPDVGETALVTAPPPAAPPLRVALHLAATLPQTAIYDAQAAVTEAGFDLAGTSVARFGVAESEVRFFHGNDAAEAARIADSLGARARDFSAYRPAPPPGTLELWLAPEG